MSINRFEQVPLQLVNPVWQVSPQDPPEQTSPAPHEVPHLPQLALSVLRLAQVPLQLVSPLWHDS